MELVHDLWGVSVIDFGRKLEIRVIKMLIIGQGTYINYLKMFLYRFT